MSDRPVILCIGQTPQQRDALAGEVRRIVGERLAVHVADRSQPGAITLDADTLTSDLISRRVCEAVTDHVLHRAPHLADELADLLDPVRVARAFSAAETLRRAMHDQLASLRHLFMTSADLTDEAAERLMIEGLDRALSHPPRQKLSPGTVLLTEGEPVTGIWIVLEGKVQLTRRAEMKEVTFHSRSVGRIVGLLAMAQRRQAFFSCRTLTDVTAVHVTWHQLDAALRNEPALAVHFMAVLIRTLTKRIRRIVELQLEVENLNSDLAAERDRLADALDQLRQAQARLVQSEKMATLGQLVAGVAHELNNPVTALRRAADFVGEDVQSLLRETDATGSLGQRLSGAMTATPLSTAELRERRDALAGAVGSDSLARRLLNLGITSADEYTRLFGSLPARAREVELARMERVHQLGTALRNIRSSAERVSAIVKSLRSYARTDAEPTTSYDVHEGLEDTLLLFGHALRTAEVVRQYGDIPRITCHAGQINQVWTNVISNALDAMEQRGRLMLATDQPDQKHVRVRIIDSGPGIPPEHRHRVFDLNFTTKHGGAAFGLGMGLLICRQIVERHGGQITIDSEPGRTCVEVVLPIESAQSSRGENDA